MNLPATGGAAAGSLERHVCRVGDGWLHYRRMGRGPAVLLLHQTPQSSQTLEPLMRLLAPHCTAIAVDTPGFGQSDPLAVAFAERADQLSPHVRQPAPFQVP